MNKLKSYKTGVIAIGGVFYDDEEDEGDDDEDDKNVIANPKFVHNFSTDGLNSDYFNITGNLATNKGNVTYGELTLNTCLKLESSTSISFNFSENYKLTVVTNSSTKNFKLDGNKVDTDQTGVTTVEISAGEHIITKAESGNIYMIIIS